MQMKTILVVCTGNICRSPMAMGFLRDKLRKEGLEGEYRVHSAGVWGLENQPPSAYARQMMAQRGIDISDHRSHDLTVEDVEGADLILTMERGQAEAISLEFPQHAGKVHLLSEMAGRHYDIRDPYGGPLHEYSQCAAEIERLIEEGYPRIMELVD
jgi:protein-tyrosine-phosphatase